MDTLNCLKNIQKYYDEGNKEVIAIMKNGKKQTLRLFMSTTGSLAYFGKGKRRRGYNLWNIIEDIESVSVKTSKRAEQTELEKYLDNLKKFKKIYTQNLHENLWSDLRDGYNRLDIEDFENFIINSDGEKNNSYDFYKLLLNYCGINNLHLNTENKYKTTTIQSNKPRLYTDNGYQYKRCLENIKKHLDNKEDFRYGWESNYDVSIEGKMCSDGIYRGWFSLEFRGCGNGHYYLLVNEKQAVFAEND